MCRLSDAVYTAKATSGAPPDSGLDNGGRIRVRTMITFAPQQGQTRDGRGLSASKARPGSSLSRNCSNWTRRLLLGSRRSKLWARLLWNPYEMPNGTYS